MNDSLERRTPMQRNELLYRLQAVADDVRLRIIEQLAQHEELSAQALIRILDVPQSSFSRHVGLLRHAGFVQERRDQGANKTYRLTRPHVQATIDALGQVLAGTLPETTKTYASHLDPAIQRYFDSDSALIHFPSKQRERFLVLSQIASEFTIGRDYHEREVNAMLKRHIGSDIANLRRFLIDFKLLQREGDGSRYWREE